jgi:lipopolysaccharide transport system ATP-binding protein
MTLRSERDDRDPAARPSDASFGESAVEIGIVGTFDVENYGDLLFPLIAQEALSRRDPCIRVVPFSVNERSERSWPYEVRSTEEIPGSIAKLAAMLIGGGQIVRFDKSYPVATPPGVNLPIAYWLVPALIAATAGKPVVWNGVGVWTGSPPAPRYDEVLSKVLSASYLVGARDNASQEHFAKRAADAPVCFIPDTAFSLERFWPLERESTDYASWRGSLGIDRPHVVIQANHAIGKYRSAIKSILRAIGDVAAVILPVCWCHGDRAEGFPAFAGRIVPCDAWLPPRLLAEIIGRAEFAIASSLHACITGLCYGVPVVRAQVGPVASDRKYEILNGFDGLALIDDAAAVARVVRRKRRIEPRVADHADRLDAYWDQVADIALNPQPLHRERAMELMQGCLEIVGGDIDQRR